MLLKRFMKLLFFVHFCMCLLHCGALELGLKREQRLESFCEVEELRAVATDMAVYLVELQTANPVGSAEHMED